MIDARLAASVELAASELAETKRRPLALHWRSIVARQQIAGELCQLPAVAYKSSLLGSA